MRTYPLRLLASMCVAALIGTGALSPVSAQEVRQMQLTDAQVASFIAAQKDFQPLAGKLLEGGDKPDAGLTAQLEDISKKHGFKSFSEFEDVGANITIVLDGLDRKSGVYTDPIEKMKAELEDIKKDSSIPDEDKKLAIDDLTQEIAAAQPLKFKENVDVVKKHQSELETLINDAGDSPASTDGPETGSPPAANAPADSSAPAAKPGTTP